jgi:hypothetical protein
LLLLAPACSCLLLLAPACSCLLLLAPRAPSPFPFPLEPLVRMRLHFGAAAASMLSNLCCCLPSIYGCGSHCDDKRDGRSEEEEEAQRSSTHIPKGLNDWCAIEVRAVTDTGAHIHADVVWIKLQRQSTGAKAAAAAAAAAAAGSEGGRDGTGEARHGRRSSRSMVGLSAVVQAARASKRGSLLMLCGAVLCWAGQCGGLTCPALAAAHAAAQSVSFMANTSVTSIQHGQVRPRGRSPCVVEAGQGPRRTQLCGRGRRRPVFPPPSRWVWRCGGGRVRCRQAHLPRPGVERRA